MIIPSQIRAARAMLAWTQADLASSSGLSEISIKNIEKGATDPRASTLDAIVRALEAAGIEFTNGGQHGVRFAKIAVGDRVKFRRASKLRFLIAEGTIGIVKSAYHLPANGDRVDIEFPGFEILKGVAPFHFERVDSGLNEAERAFLERLTSGPWTSPPLFDHRVFARLVSEKFVVEQSVSMDGNYYEITDLGRSALKSARD